MTKDEPNNFTEGQAIACPSVCIAGDLIERENAPLGGSGRENLLFCPCAFPLPSL